MELFTVLLFLLCNLVFVSSNEEASKEQITVQEYDQENVGKDLILHSSVYFTDNFNNKISLSKSWITSKAKKKTEDGSSLQYDGDWVLEKPLKDPLPNDMGLTFNQKAKHRAIAAKLFRDFTFTNRPFVIQYEVLHQDGQECGGAYLKLISKERSVHDLGEFNDKTPYTIMFGPDKCGSTNKLHFIFRHKNPLNGSFEEKHCKQAKTRIDETFTDSKPHLFRLVINPDNTFSISVDNKVINEGSLLEDFDPPVNPPKEVDDPNDKKPEDWDDRAKIPDPTATKPDDWDENAPPEIPVANVVKPADWLEDEPINISDPSAEKPDDWDEEMDGEWEAPLVPNPACEEAPGCGPWSPPLTTNPDYKGKWTPPLIDNPNFKGIWKPRTIPNPDYFEDNTPYKMIPIDAVGFEIWSVSARIMFDNLIITDDENVAKQFASLTFDKKILNIEKSADTIFNQFVAFTNRYPWLWAVYVVVLLIPITLIVVCCFWSSKDPEGEKKKNDDIGDESTPLLSESSGSYLSPSASDLNQEAKEELKENEDAEDGNVTSDTESNRKSHSRESSQSHQLEEDQDDDENYEDEAQSSCNVKTSDGSKTSDMPEEDKDDESSESQSAASQPENVLKKRK